MNKAEFLVALRHALGKLPSYEVEQTLTFYAEMIDDRIEEGMAEQEAIAALGSVEAIAIQIIAETPPVPKAIAKANTGSRTLNIVLLAVCSPLWVPLAVAFAVTAFTLYLVIWLVIAILWITVAILLLCGPLGIFGLIYLMATGYPLPGVFQLGGCLALMGLGVFAWFGVLAASKGLIQLTHALTRKIKGLFVRSGKPDAHSPAVNPPTAPNTERQGHHV